MPVTGTLKRGKLSIAQLNMDFTKNPVHVKVLAAYVDEEDPLSIFAWVPAQGNIWSQSTKDALRGLLASLEEDISRVVMDDADVSVGPPVKGLSLGGLSEHLGAVDGSGDNEPPSI